MTSSLRAAYREAVAMDAAMAADMTPSLATTLCAAYRTGFSSTFGVAPERIRVRAVPSGDTTQVRVFLDGVRAPDAWLDFASKVETIVHGLAAEDSARRRAPAAARAQVKALPPWQRRLYQVCKGRP